MTDDLTVGGDGSADRRRVVALAAVAVGLALIGIGGTVVTAAGADLPAVPHPAGRPDHDDLHRDAAGRAAMRPPGSPRRRAARPRAGRAR